MSGLGIDFGKPTAEQQPRRQQQRPHTGYGTPDSYTQLPPNSRLNISRRPTTADDRMALRRVRIASGEPGVMGHGVGHLEEDYIMSPDNQSDMGMSSVSGSSTRSISQDHRKRLSDAVAAMSDSPYDDTSPYSGTSSLYEDSPGTETSATSFTSSNRSGSSGSRRLKKQTSQPVLSRTATRRGGNASMSGPPRASAAAMNRSQSSMSLSSSYKSSESGSTLGRSAEIPRNAGRNGSTNSRGSARGRGRGGGGGRGPHIRMQTSDGSRMLPDGFGGVVPSNWLPPDARRAASDRSTPASTISPTSSTASGRHREGLPCFDGPSLMDRMGDIQDNASEAGSTRSSVRSSGAQQRVQSPEDHPQQPARPVKFRVGSFYGPNGQVVCQSERAQPDQTSASESTNAPNSAPTAHDEERGRSDQRSASSAPASQRQRSQSGPRARLMDSPTTSRQNDPQDGETKTTAEMQRSLSSSMVSMRSVAGWRGLDGAEKGEAMVSLDPLNKAFEAGELILPDRIQSMLDSTQPSPATHSARMSRSMSIAGTELAPMDSVSNVGPTQSNGSAQTEGRPAHSRSLSAAAVPSASAYTKTKATALDRQPTLLSATANPLRRSRELNRLLGTSGRKLHSSAASSVDSVISPQDAPAGGKSTGLSRSNATAGSSVPPAVLEQAKAGKARVEVDLVLESDLVVEGGMLRGRLQVKVRKDSDKDGAIMLAQPKVRVVGFEGMCISSHSLCKDRQLIILTFVYLRL